jgi:hypothetical protein
MVFSIPSEQFNPFNSNSAHELIEYLSENIFNLSEIRNTKVLIEVRNLPYRKVITTCDYLIGKDMNLLMFHSINSSKTQAKILFLIYKRFLWVLLSPRRQFKIGLGIRDFIFSDLFWQHMFKSNTEYLITTQTNLQLLPYMFYDKKNFELKPSKIMFWYSANNTLICKKKVPDSISQKFLLKNLPIDQHFVWTETEANRIEYSGAKAITAGPIIFNQNRNLEALPYDCTNKNHNLIIYDISPKNNVSADLFYNNTNLMKFLSEILEVTNSIFNNSINIYIKNKRSLNHKLQKERNGEYFQYLRTLKDLKLVRVVEASSKLEELISLSCLSIAVPFVSPVIYTQLAGIESCYYIPENCEKFFENEYNSSVNCIIGKQKLMIWLQNHKHQLKP